MTANINILIVDDDEMYRQTHSLILEQKGYRTTTAVDGADGLKKFKADTFQIVFVDYRMPDMDGLEFLRQVRVLDQKAAVVLITAFASVENAVEAIKLGAFDYLDKPASQEKLLGLVEKIIQRQRLLGGPQRKRTSLYLGEGEEKIVGESPQMLEIFDIIAKIAPTDSTVLILGDSGTGKEVIAKAIHANSMRKDGPFFTMDCGTLVESLVESELFGHVKGSFTGAEATKHGAFELADKGTFFFDEIGNISPNVQAKVLRAIQEKEIRKVGGTETVSVDVRVIAATNLDLYAAVQQGQFREDLYYRLSVIPIYLPPLRERREDIPLLINHFITKLGRKKTGTPVHGLSDHALEALLAYKWPGNIRELGNVIERAIVIEEDSIIHWSSLPAHIRSQAESKSDELTSLKEMEKAYIDKVLRHTKYNISQAARILKIDRKTLYDKMKKYDLK